MEFESFRLNVVARLASFAALVFVAIWGVVATSWQLAPIVAAVLAIIILIELVRYVESVNSELASFLEFVEHDDFSASFPISQKGRPFERLEFAYKQLQRKYRALNEARELNHRYLESLVEHVSVALICLDESGNVVLMNQRTRQLFRVPHLSTVNSLSRIDRTLPATLTRLCDGDRTLLKLEIGGESLQLTLYVTEFDLLEHGYKLISFQNIRTELEEREIRFSERLIKVLTHEIMNSVTPIIALSKVIEDALTELPTKNEDLLRSVTSIQQRSDGLLRFVQAYRSLTGLPKPAFRMVRVAELLEQTQTLLTPVIENAGVTLAKARPGPDIAVRVDPEQIQQVLINLVNNAIEAMEGQADGQIALGYEPGDTPGIVVIRVSDNGPGINEENIESIFVPFFTTRRAGTGVGLSISRQILLLNRGFISVRSQAGTGTTFRLELPVQDATQVSGD